MAWNGPAPSHYQNQCWDIVNLTLRNKLQWNIYRNSYIFIQENAFEYVIWEMAAILSQPQCVNTLYYSIKQQHLWVSTKVTQLRSNVLMSLLPWSIHMCVNIRQNITKIHWPGPVFCLLLRVSSGCARPFTGQVTSVTWPVIGWAESELTPGRDRKWALDSINIESQLWDLSMQTFGIMLSRKTNSKSLTAKKMFFK